MEELQKWELINKCTTLDELSEAILAIGENGVIQGRQHEFDIEDMAKRAKQYSLLDPNMLTRSYGIRQQAMMIEFYT